jgi:hypothetical protein
VPYLASLLGDARAITSGVPSTTATSLASLGTGLVPGQHGLVGYTSRVAGHWRAAERSDLGDRPDRPDVPAEADLVRARDRDVGGGDHGGPCSGSPTPG